MTSKELREKFLTFFEKRGHQIVPSSSLVPTDSSVLFTTAGMQQFKEYFLDKPSPYGPNVSSCQKCFRTSDINEVGDETHLTFLEMLGNFSFGGYFKKETIQLAYDFLFKELKIPVQDAIFTVFEGDEKVPFDEESIKIWKSLGISENRIKKCGRSDNFWGPTGLEGPCGPTTEIHINGVEVWNLVFNEYYQNKEGELSLLGQKGVDTGMGLERLAMIVQGKNNIFDTDLFSPVIKLFPDWFEERKKRIISDHAKASVFLISDGIIPSNKDQGYVLRRLLRRMIIHSRDLSASDIFAPIVKNIELYNLIYKLDEDKILSIVKEENDKFQKTLDAGIKIIKKMDRITGKEAFNIYETYGLPLEVLEEIHQVQNREQFFEELKLHQDLSKKASAGMFKGGLVDDNPKTVKLHTAHHLLLAALQQLFGKNVKQRGSNINSERLRIDFSFNRKITDEEIDKLEKIVNEKIKEGLDVIKKEMPKEEAEKIGAEMEFGVKYDDTVSVYFVQDKNGNIFSKEFCGGPHVQRTSEIGNFQIIKEESSGAGVRRIKAILK